MKFRTFDGGELGRVCIPEDTDPQHYAMLAAWFSRSTETVDTMVAKVEAEGSDGFLERFYVGYGHESIGDLVDVKLFIHGIPLYLAPLIEHHSLFRGQESSTRYIDFSQQRCYGPEQDVMAAQIKEYVRARAHVSAKLLEINRPDTPSRLNAVHARAFDIVRCLIPLGATTNVAWFGSIRSIKGHLAWMFEQYPFSRPWVEHIYKALRTMYPASMERSLDTMRPHEPWVFDRSAGLVSLHGLLDFGSWRDLNRHRVGRHSRFRLPPIGINANIHPWYVEMLNSTGFVADAELLKRARWIDDVGVRLLGQEISYSYEMPGAQAKYFCWRRNQLDVHPTLRLQVEELAISLGYATERVPDVGLGYVERRGTQTIALRVDEP